LLEVHEAVDGGVEAETGVEVELGRRRAKARSAQEVGDQLAIGHLFCFMVARA